jgi:uncharacterized iron-regulated protein
LEAIGDFGIRIGLQRLHKAMRSIIPWIALSLCLSLVSCGLSIKSGHATQRRSAATNPDEQFWRAVEKADVIYVGETHDDPAHHEYELKLIRGLLGRKVKFAVGWEMFDETQQSSIDAWASHKISLEELLVKTDFQKRWGIYSPVYEQILRITEKANVRNLALNAPPELVRKIAQAEPLTAEEIALLPSGFVADSGAYKNFVALIGEHPGVAETDLRRYFDAQNAWDQTMANRILEFKRRNPKVKLVVLTGRDHVFGGYGIPFYLRQKAHLKQLVLFPKGRLDLGLGQKEI